MPTRRRSFRRRFGRRRRGRSRGTKARMSKARSRIYKARRRAFKRRRRFYRRKPMGNCATAMLKALTRDALLVPMKMKFFMSLTNNDDNFATRSFACDNIYNPLMGQNVLDQAGDATEYIPRTFYLSSDVGKLFEKAQVVSSRISMKPVDQYHDGDFVQSHYGIHVGPANLDLNDPMDKTFYDETRAGNSVLSHEMIGEQHVAGRIGWRRRNVTPRRNSGKSGSGPRTTGRWNAKRWAGIARGTKLDTVPGLQCNLKSDGTISGPVKFGTLDPASQALASLRGLTGGTHQGFMYKHVGCSYNDLPPTKHFPVFTCWQRSRFPGRNDTVRYEVVINYLVRYSNKREVYNNAGGGQAADNDGAVEDADEVNEDIVMGGAAPQTNPEIQSVLATVSGVLNTAATLADAGQAIAEFAAQYT